MGGAALVQFGIWIILGNYIGILVYANLFCDMELGSSTGCALCDGKSFRDLSYSYLQ